MEEDPFTTGSGNVFTDLGFDDQEAEYLAEISRLRCIIDKAIDKTREFSCDMHRSDEIVLDELKDILYIV